VFLTEPEKYPTAIRQRKGEGMIASYGTNDAGALNALKSFARGVEMAGRTSHVHVLF